MASIRTLPGEGGFLIVELLVALTITFVVLAGTVAMLAAARMAISDQILRVETVQGVRATLDLLARDLRLAGACLPATGEFVSLDGADAGSTDRLMLRTGSVSSGACVRTTIREDMPRTSREIKVESASGFEEGGLAYIRHPDGTGEIVEITQVQIPARMLQHAGQLSQDYPVGSGVFAVEQQEYAIDASNPDLPVFTVARGGGDPVPFAVGVESLDIKYVLGPECPPCGVVSFPAADEWSFVNEIRLGVTGRSRIRMSDDRYYRYAAEITAKPRNLLPGG